MADVEAGAPGTNESFTSDLDEAFSAPDAVDTAADTEVADAEPVAEAESAADASAVDVEPVATEQAADAVDTEQTPAEELPEGVRVIEKDGGKEYRVRETQFNQFREGHNFRRELEQRLVPETKDGAAPTLDDVRAAVDRGQKAAVANEDMHLDFISGEPAAQRRFIDHFLSESKYAVDNGEVASDPVTPFAATFFDAIAEKHPGAYAALQGRAANLLLNDLYELAANDDNKNLFLSLQHVERQIFNRYRDKEGKVIEAAPTRRTAPARQPARQEENRRPAADQTFENFRVKTHTDSNTAIRQKAETSLATVRDAYVAAKLPQTFERILDGLNSSVHNKLKGDAEWQSQIRLLVRQAQLSPSEQKRLEIGQQIVRRHATRAQQIIDANMGEIVAEASRATKVKFDADHARRTAAQTKRAPSGGGPAPKTSLVPTRQEEWSGVKSFESELDSMFA